ncbi:hypothetical protein GA0070622_1214 [Micromonospora sediminicola]|uniref:Uncharacterized protein n=1 Tax=Micromonospora sediminicola TaxID=946078 RepID=A0A1A9B5D7_9ACTN|nr:hypothetical protein [Micromonospora sediminicola]SBT64244.1 hypothetical protein GA0070622_1214 [Micromonospora sediminicola]
MTKDELLTELLVERYGPTAPPQVEPEPLVRDPQRWAAPPDPPARRRHLVVLDGGSTTTAAA